MSWNMCICRHKLWNAKMGVGPTFTWSNEAWYMLLDPYSSWMFWIISRIIQHDIINYGKCVYWWQQSLMVIRPIIKKVRIIWYELSHLKGLSLVPILLTGIIRLRYKNEGGRGSTSNPPSIYFKMLWVGMTDEFKFLIP